ncbi:MAG: response regulator [Cyanobacteria bacterium P01_A01_bin.116]
MSVLQRDSLSVLIVDDDEVDRMALKRALGGTDFNLAISEAADATAALQITDSAQHDLIFLDYNLPGENGLELTRHIRNRGIRVPVIVLTGQGNEQTAVELMKAGATDYLPKPKLSTDVIMRLMRGALRVYDAEVLIERANQDLIEKNALLEEQNRELEKQRQYIYKQNLQLQEVARLKTEFLATMSHELRTPLNAIIGFSQILISKSKGILSEKQTDMLTRILANGKNLLELINDILAFSKIEANRLSLNIAPLKLDELVQSTVEELESLATQKHLKLIVEIDLQDPAIVNDDVRLRQVIVNLLSNAIKFTDLGSVRVSVSDQVTQTANGPNHEILISVADTGCGISAEGQTLIFDPFHQADQKVTRRHAGTGLGLAITHSLIKMMKGEITLDSQVNVGSTFTVMLPRKVERAHSQGD